MPAGDERIRRAITLADETVVVDVIERDTGLTELVASTRDGKADVEVPVFELVGVVTVDKSDGIVTFGLTADTLDKKPEPTKGDDRGVELRLTEVEVGEFKSGGQITAAWYPEVTASG